MASTFFAFLALADLTAQNNATGLRSRKTRL
jgi:hypothetical protein